MENVSVDESYSLTGNSGCSHQFCMGCLASYLTNRISEAQLRNPCPNHGRDDCTAEASSADIEILCPAMLEKFDRFSKMKTDENHRDCPKCSHMQIGDFNHAAMKCDSCQYEYCFFHSDSHPGQSCIQLASRIRMSDFTSSVAVCCSTKKCPHCKTPTTKNGGCNHMTCQSCHESWCWLCRQKYEYGHFDSNNVICGCPGLQYAPDFMAYLLPLYKIAIICLIVLAIPFLILASPYFLYKHCSGGDACSCDCNCESDDDDCGRIALVMFLLMLFIPWFFIVLALELVMSPFLLIATFFVGCEEVCGRATAVLFGPLYVLALNHED